MEETLQKLEKAKKLKQELLEFVLDAEGDLAVALESFSAQKLSNFSKSQYQGQNQNDMVLDMFLSEGRIENQTPIDLFLIEHPNLSDDEGQIVGRWKNSFAGLFAVNKILSHGFEVLNWLTQKSYLIIIKDEAEKQQLARVKTGEIILTRIAPINDSYWMFSAPITLLGKLGKPKLAVAIGNFKQNYKSNLYGDAPELLEEAWNSVEKYHQAFVDFFGGDEVTLPGYKLQKRLSEFQEKLTEEKLAAAGVDSSKSLEELTKQAGVSSEEIAETAESMGMDGQAAVNLLNSQKSAKMVMPPVELPSHLKNAEEVTVVAHPRWGQVFLTNYTLFNNLLQTSDWQSIDNSEKLVREYLESPDISTFIWQRSAERYPTQLEDILRKTLNQPNFNLHEDLNDLLQKMNKSITPELPEIASVPIHLHNLFQEALMEVNKKQKSKSKAKSKTGFGFK
ncbi:MAG: hypothetical protein AAF378_10485 [Cyanobacteria bacterium P01_A01_bin.84]